MMTDIDREMTTEELRDQLPEVVEAVAHSYERVGITQDGELTAVLVSVFDVDLLDAFETAADLRALRDVLAEDDGTRVTLEELREELGVERES